MRVALLSCNAQAGDAIGNSVADKLAFFRERAAEVRIFVQSDQHLHPALSPYCQRLRAPELRGDAWRFLRSADVVIVEFGQFYSLLSLLPALAGGRPRIILDYHGITPPDLWGGHNREALVNGLRHRGLAWCADATVTHSAFTHDELLALTGLPAQRLPRLGFPVDRTHFTPGPADPGPRQAVGLTGQRVLLFVGRLAPNKRPVLLIEALDHLRDLTPAVHAVLVGDASDLYQTAAQRCHQRAAELGLADRVHLVGPQRGRALRDWYRAADVLVMPSRWESFCIPVVEAMACGLPVVAARTTALPETVAGAGLTFVPDDAADLARQVRRVLEAPASAEELRRPMRVAVVASRFGADLASGAEASLRHMALGLRQGGCEVEVWTTCTSAESGGSNDLSAGTSLDEGLIVHRFPVDASAEGPAIRSQALLAALERRVEEFDVVLTGPYLAPLTFSIAERWPTRAVVAPCFHDEPAARLDRWPVLYDCVAGLLFHSPEEQTFAESVLGVNHPASAVIGAVVDPPAGNAGRGQAAAGGVPYVLYSGRLVEGKNVPLLLEYARRFAAEHPDRLHFVFTGQGNVPIPREPWAVDLGLVAPEVQRDLLAGALALVQLSRNESLSLAALEAWAQGTAVMAHRQCAVLAGHAARSGGALLVDGYHEFAAALCDLLDKPALRDHLGAEGRQYVAANYGSAEEYRTRLLHALEQTRQPLAAQMRRRGLERAARFDRATWRAEFGALIENVLHAGPRELRPDLHVQPRTERAAVRVGTESLLIAVRVVNRGTEVAVAEGPARTVLCGVVMDSADRVVRQLVAPTSLPVLVMPGRAVSASVLVALPPEAGRYEVRLWARRLDRKEPCGPVASVALIVGDGDASTTDGCAGLLDEVQTALAGASQLQRLPDDYTDVTQGALAGLKRRVKQKFLGNFKKAYVDVLSRQQTACNEQLLEAVQLLTECCATLDHALRELQQRVARLEAAPGNRQPPKKIGPVGPVSPMGPVS
jgi:glycosyltransferase involved in cell wall biosynthesis